ELPITDVTVFSDRARITRSGALPVSGRQRLELVSLGDTTDVSSLNVESSGADLETVELLPPEEDQLPVTEAKTLLKALEENADGPSRFAVTYVALRARWIPTYDVQLQPDTGKVQVAFAGLVSQETGDDWSDAQLTLSTAIPSQANQFPKLLTWKIGQKERFI